VQGAYQLKMHQNDVFFIYFFLIFDISTSKPSKNTPESINFMHFQGKNNLKSKKQLQKQTLT
jgi:hypothetical protein